MDEKSTWSHAWQVVDKGTPKFAARPPPRDGPDTNSRRP